MSEPISPSDEGFHTRLIKKRLPDWIKHLKPQHFEALSRARDPAQTFQSTHAALFAQARPELRQALLDSQARSQASHHALAKTLKDFKGITEFATPLLTEAMRNEYGLTPDVNDTELFHLRAPNRFTRQPLLQAALRNFEADEPFDEVALQETSALAPAGSLQTLHYGEPLDNYGARAATYVIRDKLPIRPASYANMCRTLDLGQQYQNHLSTVFDSPGTAAHVREQMIGANKDTLRIQAHIARMQSHITESAHATLLQMLNGAAEPTLDAQAVAYSRLHVLGSALSEILIIGAAARNAEMMLYDFSSELGPQIRYLKPGTPDSRIIVYIPGDPLSPVKEHASLKAFAADLAINLRATDYQRFFAGFVPQEETATFFHRLKTQLKTLRWNPKPDLPEYYSISSAGIYEEVWNEDADLRPQETFFGVDVFGERYALYVARLKAHARLLAVPVAQVDHEAWVERLKQYAEWGMNVLNVAAFFVPGLGEVMLAVTAVQLSLEVYHGFEAWEAGDAEEAWEHLKSVLLNVAFMAVLAGATSAPKILGSEAVNGLVRVKLPNGDIKLWKPDLVPYQSDVSLEGLQPNALGQYTVADKTFIRQENKVYEKVFDPEIKKWRLKHPADPEAYQPVLNTNNAGAWRHKFEWPLEWDRARLLRRMGHATDAFSDAQLAQIADISGVSDDALRQMHVDHQVPPPLLAETLKQFTIDRDVNQMIEQVRTGQPIVDNRYNYALASVVEMPRWPLGRVIEVFEATGLTGPSTRFGFRSDLVKPAIRVTKAQVSSSRLPSIILAALDEQEIEGLLGGEGARVVRNRLAVFREQIADHLQTQTAPLFESVYKGTEPGMDELKLLRRSQPGLPADAAQELLSTLTPLERQQLRNTRRIPLKLFEQGRWFVQQARLNRAFAGLHLASLASLDSERLALHALEKLPGWSNKVRIEVREGHPRGPLRDSIGSQTATERKYLIKQGQQFQAHDANGNALNSVPRHGRNFFASIMHALPDSARSDLGLPHVAQSPELQKAVAQYALAHRDEMSRVLGQQAIKPRFRAPPKGYSAYSLSGRGAGREVDSLLVTRVRDLYPDLTDELAERYVWTQLMEGKTARQVFNELNNRTRELAGLRASLEQWVASDDPHSGFGWSSRQNIADSVIRCWRSAPGLGVPVASYLDLTGAGPLPPLVADFSHVSTLRVTRAELEGSAGEALFQQFPAVKRLKLWLAEGTDLPEAVTGRAGLTELQLGYLQAADWANVQPQLNRMVQLESLSLRGQLERVDVSRLKNLRTLELVGAQLQDWPTGVLELESLETLNLQENPLTTLPEQLLSGHERLWRGLSIDWATLDHETFMSAYRYLKGNPAHLVDVERLADAYWNGTFDVLVREASSRARSLEFVPRAREEGVSNEALLERAKELREEHAVLTQHLDEWQHRAIRVDRQPTDNRYRTVIAKRLMTCWRERLVALYGEDRRGNVPGLQERLTGVLDLTGWALGGLPELPGGDYNHVLHLNLAGTKVPEVEISAFLRKFPQLRQLNLSANGLTELPSAVTELAHLTELHVDANEIRSTSQFQAHLNRMGNLEALSLSRNPVQTLDVSRLARLKFLDLSATALNEWPTGVWELPQLRSLYLNRSAISSIPDVALVGHDQRLATAGLRGCPLTEEAFTRRQTILERYYASIRRTVPAIELDRAHWGTPEYFPAVEDETSIAQNLLPELAAQASGPTLSPAERLRELDPGMGDVEAAQVIDRLRAQGLSGPAVDTRIALWRQEHQALTSKLNDWINIKAHDVAGARISSLSRRRAADAILMCWRQEIRARVPSGVPIEGDVLDLADMPLGDLPALPRLFTQVQTLNLRGVKLTEQGSNAFLNGFPNLRRLVLDKNELVTLPVAVTGLHKLTRLEAGYNYLSRELLQPQLNRLPGLEWLDVQTNNLDQLDITALPRLKTLNLRDNGLKDWPTGALQARELRTLDLSDNVINEITWDELLRNPELMLGTDLSSNDLSREHFVLIRDYYERTGSTLGYSIEMIDEEIGSSSDDESVDEHVSSDENLDEVIIETETHEQQLMRWLTEGQADAVQKRAVWYSLKAQEDNQAFFHLLGELKQTKDFTDYRADLTRRVWSVIEAANSDDSLRRTLFGQARSGYTCGDGRILLFSDLEITVLEFNTLRSAPAGQEGHELLKLSRSLFRLAEVDKIAFQDMSKALKKDSRLDPAEFRLVYRIDLSQRLELPAQPHGMLYRDTVKIAPEDIDTAFAKVLEAELSPAFMTQLVEREFWVQYLRRKYPVEFAQSQQRLQVRYEALEELHPEFDEAHHRAFTDLDNEAKAEEKALIIELSQRESTANPL